MEKLSHWSSGDHILYREVWQGRVWTARPVIVIQDLSSLIVLYLGAGTRWKKPAPIGASEDLSDCLLSGDWQLVDAVWIWDSVLLICPGEAHAVHIMRGEGKGNAEFVGWYINLQEPVRRTELGFDFMDQELDVVVRPDLSGWRWKDEELLERAQKVGRFSLEQAELIRAEAERVIERARTRAYPFNQGWEHWYPPADWCVPELPQGWEEVRAN